MLYVDGGIGDLCPFCIERKGSIVMFVKVETEKHS
jgi:hypothetical protein